MGCVQIDPHWLETCLACPDMCRNACPSFLESRVDLFTPRARVTSILANSFLEEQISSCLACSLCAVACRAGVSPDLVVASSVCQPGEKATISLGPGDVLVPGMDTLLYAPGEVEAFLKTATSLGAAPMTVDLKDLGTWGLMAQGKAPPVIRVRGRIVSLSPLQTFHARRLGIRRVIMAHEAIARSWTITVEGRRPRIILHIPHYLTGEEARLLTDLVATVADVTEWRTGPSSPWVARMDGSPGPVDLPSWIRSEVEDGVILVSPLPAAVHALSPLEARGFWSFLAGVVEPVLSGR